MKEKNTEYWQEELNKVLKEEGMIDQQFHEFMKGKIKILPLMVEEFGWGVFPITNEDGVLVDIRMVIPTIYDIKSLCVNIHEYTHAYEAYLDLGKVYIWHIEESEQKARAAENRYLKSLNKITHR